MKQHKEDLIRYMAENGIYPFISQKGRLFFVCKKAKLSDQEKERLAAKLKIENKEECNRIRAKIKDMANKIRQTRPIKEWLEDERPREMLIKYGAEKLPVSKLLAIILRTGSEGVSAEELSKRILNRFGNLRELDSAPVSDICKIEGVGIAKAAQIKAAFELGKRLIKEEAEKRLRIRTPEDAIRYVMDYYGPYLRDAKKEFFYIVLLDIKNQPIYNLEISKGGTNKSIVEPKEIIKEAALRSASSIILVHNHPSGDPYPSAQDIELTKKIKKACELVDIKVLDHIIIGKNSKDYFSFCANSLI